MTTVDVRATLPASVPAAHASHKTIGDGFARELEAATRPEPRVGHDSGRDSDAQARTKATERGQAADKARRAHDQQAAAQRAHGAVTNDKVREAKGRDAGTASDSSNVHASNAYGSNADGSNADARGAAAATDDAAAADRTNSDAAGADGKIADGAPDSAASTAAAALATASTDSVGPGTSSSGEASQDPAVTSILAGATIVAASQEGSQAGATDMGASDTGAKAQAASTVSEGASSTHHAGVTSSRSVESDAAKAAGSTTPEPADSGKVPAVPVVVVGASAGGSGDQGVGQDGGTGAHARTSGKANSDAAGATVTAAFAQPTVGVEKADALVSTAAAPAITAASTAPASVTTAAPGIAPIDPGVQVTAPTPIAQASAAQPALPVPLSTQLTGQLTSLRQLPHGEHILTLTVNPETFGPVKVVAHITPNGVSLELFGASDQARAALKAALPDLRRDLAGAGLEPHLELGNGSGSSAGGRDAMGDSSSFAGNGNTPQRSARSPLAGTAPAAAPTSAPHATRRGGLDLVL